MRARILLVLPLVLTTLTLAALPAAAGENVAIDKTIGTEPGVCASDDFLEVTAGTPVYYCFTLTNVTGGPVVIDSVEDSFLGVLTPDLLAVLPSGIMATDESVLFIVELADPVGHGNQVRVCGSFLGAKAGSSASPFVPAGSLSCDEGSNFSDSAFAELSVNPVRLTKTVGLVPETCDATDTATAVVGQTVTYCYLIENLSDWDLDVVFLSDDQLGDVPGAPTFIAANTSVQVLADVAVFDDVVNEATVCVLTAIGDDIPLGPAQTPECFNPACEVSPGIDGATFCEGYTSTDTATVTVETPAPALTVTKTVGTSPTVCGAAATLEVAAGTTVYYCYTATNTGNVTFTLHDLVDDKIGTVLDDFPLELTPGMTKSVFSTGTVINEAVTNTAVWTATTIDLADPPTEAGVGDAATTNVVVTATATVTVTQVPTPTTTPTVQPTPTPVAVGPDAATPAPIAFTGSNTAPMLVLAITLIGAGLLAVRTARRSDQT